MSWGFDSARQWRTQTAGCTIRLHIRAAGLAALLCTLAAAALPDEAGAGVHTASSPSPESIAWPLPVPRPASPPATAGLLHLTPPHLAPLRLAPLRLAPLRLAKGFNYRAFKNFFVPGNPSRKRSRHPTPRPHAAAASHRKSWRAPAGVRQSVQWRRTGGVWVKRSRTWHLGARRHIRPSSWLSIFAPHLPGPAYVPNAEHPGTPYDRPSGSYRTMCVRLCDGYYWPVSFATHRSRFHRDNNVCQASCDAPVRLFYAPSPGTDAKTMTDLTGRHYSRLDNAFRYRTERVKSCRCRPASWSAAAKDRHTTYRTASMTDQLSGPDRAETATRDGKAGDALTAKPDPSETLAPLAPPDPSSTIAAVPPPIPATLDRSQQGRATHWRTQRPARWRRRRRRPWGSTRRRTSPPTRFTGANRF